MKTWMTHGFDKIIVDMPAPEKLDKEYALYLTKGGKGTCQIVVNNEADTKVSLKANLASGVECNVYSLDHSCKINDGHLHSDPLVPYDGQVMDVKAGISLPFLLDVKADNAGDESVTFDILDAEGKVIDTFTLNLHVWSFSLPREKAFATSAGINRGAIAGFDTDPEAHKAYYDLLLENNICGHSLPYDILDERADAYMSDPNVSSFVIGLWEAKNWTDEKITQYYNKVASNPEWLKKAMIYVIDEPSTEEALAKYHDICARFARLTPGIGVISPFYTNKQMGERMDQVDAMADCTTLWCPKLNLWDESESYTPFLDYTPEKSFGQRFKEFQKRGDTVWSYVCNNPITPYAQLFIDTDGLMHRLMIWQHYQREAAGFLYWGTCSWGPYHSAVGDPINPWENVYNGVGDGYGHLVAGEGFLTYPGAPVGLKEPMPSLRLKILRDALDDIELLLLAEKHLGKEWVMAKTYEATPTLTSYTTPERFVEIRKEIGDALEAVLAK